MQRPFLTGLTVVLAAAAFALALEPCDPAWAAPCVVPDDGTGTATLPPPGCGYVSPNDLHVMINGLPPGTTITLAPEHNRFFITSVVPHPDGSRTETFTSSLNFALQGRGSLSGWTRPVVMNNVQCRSWTGPRPPGPEQSFPTEMQMMQGQLPPGDPDFDLLRITAGGGFGMPSPGHTTLTAAPGGQWHVDSFFDITYRIDFVGKPGGLLGGMSGSTTGTIRMATGVATDVPQITPTPAEGKIVSISPNPFRPSTTINFALPTGAGEAGIEIFDATGRVVRSLGTSTLAEGIHSISWDGRDAAGAETAPGAYFFRLRVNGHYSESQKAIRLQ